MAQYIQKYNKGNKLDGLKAQFNSAYQTASAEDKAKVEGYLQSALNYASVDRMNNRSQRQFEELVYSNALGMLNGTFQNVPSAGVSTKNIFNGYNRRENTQNADQLAYNYLNQNKKSSTASNNSSSNSNSSTGGSYKYVWNHGWSSDWATEGEALEDRLAAFTDMLTTNMSDLLKHKQKGDKIFGFNGSSEEADIQSTLNALLLIKSGIGTLDSKQLLKKLAIAARRAGADAQSFKDYFGEYMILTQSEKNLNNLKRLGWSVTTDPGTNAALSKYLTDNNYKILTDKSGNAYLFDADYNQIKGKGFVEANTNWTDEGQYGQGYGVDDNGRLWYGNTDDIAGDHFLLEKYNNFLKSINEKNKALSTNSQGAFDDVFSYSDHDLLKNLNVRKALHGKLFVDLGLLFKGDQQVIAVPTQGTLIKRDKYGNIKLDSGLTFYYQHPDGSIKTTTNYNDIKEILGGFNISGFGEENSGIADTLNWYNNIMTADRGDLSTAMTTTGDSKVWDWSRIHDNPHKWLGKVFKILSTGNAQAIDVAKSHINLNNFGFTDNPAGLAGFIQSLVESTNYQMSDEEKLAYRKLLEKARDFMVRQNNSTLSTVTENKNGGILYALNGLVLDMFGNPITQTKEGLHKLQAHEAEQKLIQDANKNGRTITEEVANQRMPSEKLSTADVARFGAVAMDVAGLITSLTGLNAVSAGTGVASTATNLFADIADESVSKGQVLKNALMNAGFAALSWIPGMNSAKILKSVVNIAPKIIGLVGAGMVILDDDVLNSLKKTVSNKSLTVQDWKNIGIAVSAAASSVRIGKSYYNGKKAAKTYTMKGKNHQVETANGEKVTINDAEKKSIDALLKEGKIDEAKTKLATITSRSPSDFEDDIFKVAGTGIKGKFTRSGLKSEEVKKLDFDAMKAALEADKNRIETWSKSNNPFKQVAAYAQNKLGGGDNSLAIRDLMIQEGIAPDIKWYGGGARSIDDLKAALTAAKASRSVPARATTGTGTAAPAGSATPSTPSTGTTSAVTSARKAIMNKKLNAFSDKEVVLAVRDLKKAGVLQRPDGKPVSFALTVEFIKYMRKLRPNKSLDQVLNNKKLKGVMKRTYKKELLAKGYSKEAVSNIMQALLRKGGQLPNYTMFFNV